jgi:hypothetical protein
LAGRVRHYASTLEIRPKRRVFRARVDRQAPIFRQRARAKVGFGGEYGNRRAERADGAGFWAYNCRIKQLAHMECDLLARTTPWERRMLRSG